MRKTQKRVFLLRELWIAGIGWLIGLNTLAADKPGSEALAQREGWHSYSPRPELAPRFWTEQTNGGLVLGIASQRHPSPDGRWIRHVPVQAGKFYRFQADWQAKNVPYPVRSVVVRIGWEDQRGQRSAPPEYISIFGPTTADGWQQAIGILQVPEKTVQARLELHLRWTSEGEVRWRNIQFVEAQPPPAKKVRLAVVHHRPRGGKTPEDNLQQFVPLLEEAARQKADIVCLGELITYCGLGKKPAELAEPIPGPSTQFLANLARKHHFYLATSIHEQEGNLIYNTAVLLGRDGTLVGKYRKVCIPHEEIDDGITPGDAYPVYDTDLGRVGMMICWDVHFPEIARALASQGAEILLLPIWGGNETLAQARSIENQVFLLASGYDFRSAIYNRRGEALCRAEKESQVLVVEVDLAEKVYWPWLGHWRTRIWPEAPPLFPPKPIRP
ncbi:MAG: carbon-nitrogen hydrolase family protein [Thermoguttaceae bacterium]|nr:carbon-nitrogen hydrolase family protein [Thermoguttaceae bacterium]MDW8039064.1 carbon-nitrogen hydrolase family protein [Thermoguttaceae bacterium]